MATRISELVKINGPLQAIMDRITAKIQSNPAPEEDNETKYRRSQMYAQRLTQFERSGAPKEFRNLIANGLVRARRLAKVGAAVKSHARIILLHGPPRTGKTMGAVWAMWQRMVLRDELLLSGKRDIGAISMFITSYDYSLISPWTQAQGDHSLAAVLVLDDLGREQERGRVAVEELIMRRWSEERPTYITTNATLEQFAGVYDARVVDRVMSDRAVVLEFEEKIK